VDQALEAVLLAAVKEPVDRALLVNLQVIRIEIVEEVVTDHKVLRSRLLEIEQAKQNAEIAGARKAQVGTGDRSERIRTYNFPQGRVSDHRIGLTLYKIEAIMNGDIDEIIDALITADTAEKLKAEE
ncbi:MAG: hypothetical protein II190_01355, partial [Ruminococcus sp.]|nr:hypothetical protein [Ruminococcus sp.]